MLNFENFRLVEYDAMLTAIYGNKLIVQNATLDGSMFKSCYKHTSQKWARVYLQIGL